MQVPIDAFFSWFQNLSPAHKTDIAATVGYGTLGFSELETLGNDSIAEDFEKIVREHCTSPIRAVGATLSLRAGVDFFFRRYRGDRQEWKENEYNMRALADLHDSEKFRDLANQMPLRREQWLRTCSEWDDVRSKHLSDEYLEQWLEESAPGRGGA